MPTITAESPESFSAQIFKIPTYCLSTTLTLRNPGQRRLEIKIPFANQSIFSCYRVQNLLSEIMWYEVNRCQRWRYGTGGVRNRIPIYRYEPDRNYEPTCMSVTADCVIPRVRVRYFFL